jgi:hypothetical protein
MLDDVDHKRMIEVANLDLGSDNIEKLKESNQI